MGKRSARSTGTVLALVLLFSLSAAIRLGTSASAVLAAGAPSDMPETRAQKEEATKSENTPSLREMDGMLEAFEQREAEIAAKEAKIKKRMRALEAANQKIDERLAALKAAEEELRATLALASTAAEDDLSRLTTVYENMKPKTAAALFEEMAPEFAAGFIGRMRPEAAAAVMAGMKPDVAYTVSVILAGRNANVPKN